MRVGMKIFALVGFLGVIALGVAGLGISTLRTYNQAVLDVENASTRALYGERLNRLVTAVVMESRGIYASKDKQEAARFGKGLVSFLEEIDALLAKWAPLVPADQKAKFDAVVKWAAEFRAFRLELVRLGSEVSPQAADRQGNNETNRTNRRNFQVAIDELTKQGTNDVQAINSYVRDLYASRLMMLIVIALGGTAGALAIAGFIGYRQISRPLRAATQAIQRLAAGDYRLPEVRAGRDEIGDIWRTMGVFASTMQDAERLRAAQADHDAAMAARRRQEMDDLARQFEGSVGGLVQHLSSAAQQMEATARSMSATAQQTNMQSQSVASAAEQTSANVQAVATATEELAASANEIGAQVSQTSRAAARAVENAQRTNERVQALSAGAQKIGDVVALISTIAGQTNLLALNATIEAARAGEAGRGFAVVASEVKELANQTSRATEDITAQISQIQHATSDAVSAIEEIGAIIQEVHGIAMGVAAAVEQQQAATQEIARNVSEAARGTQEVTENIGQVQGAATDAGSAAAQVLAAAGELARNSGELNREVEAFLATVRAA